MGSLGPSRLGDRPPPRRRGGEPGPHEPALQGAFGGRGVRGEPTAQHHADQARSPTRMLPAQGQGRLHGRLRALRCRGPAAVITGDHGRLALLPEAVDQPPDGARGEPKGSGDGGSILAVRVTPPKSQVQGHGDGTRHGSCSGGDAVRRTRPACIHVPSCGQTSCRDSAAQPYVG